jgi:hypothetical protein
LCIVGVLNAESCQVTTKRIVNRGMNDTSCGGLEQHCVVHVYVGMRETVR